jgi:hypothetical protein
MVDAHLVDSHNPVCTVVSGVIKAEIKGNTYLTKFQTIFQAIITPSRKNSSELFSVPEACDRYKNRDLKHTEVS